MAKARNAVGNILVLAGVGMVLFALLWWGVAVRRIAVFPSGFDLETPSEGTVTRLAAKHGMLMLSPGQKEEFGLGRSLSSMDGDYRSDIAVVQETIKAEGPAPFGLDLSQQNVYVMNRRSCENVESSMSTTAGEVVDRSGSWSINFPFGAKKESRNIFDNCVGSSFSVHYVRPSSADGVATYLFRGSHGFRPLLGYVAESMGLPPQTTYGELKAELLAMGLPVDELVRNASPGLTAEERAAFEQFPDSRTVSLNYSAKTEWEAEVEPVTGTIVNLRNSVTHIYVNTDVQTFLPLFEILANRSEDPAVLQYLSQVDQQKLTEPKELYRVEYRWTTRAVRNATDYAGPRVAPMRFVTSYLMTMMLLLGAAFFVGGFVVRRKEHRSAVETVIFDDGAEAGEEEGP